MRHPSRDRLRALLVGGVVMLLVSLYQYRNPPVGIARIVSPMAKQLIGMLCILFAVLVFLSQFIPERGP